MMDASRHYRIGEMAERTGVSVGTLRYYQKAPTAGMGRHGQKVAFACLSDAVVIQVKFIRQAQSLGNLTA